MTFSSAERALFVELVVQVVILLGPCKVGSDGRGRKRERPTSFEPGDYVGGQADESDAQEKHLMLEYCGVIDSGLRHRFRLPQLIGHLEQNAEKFGIDLTWVIECFFGVARMCHPPSLDGEILLPDPFSVPPEFERLFKAFMAAGYVERSGQFVSWTKKTRAIIAVIAWGVFTENGKEARRELREIWEAMPPSWREKVLELPRTSRLFDDLQDALSNHWYGGEWHDTPIRGDREPIYMRHCMFERGAYLWQMANEDIGVPSAMRFEFRRD